MRTPASIGAYRKHLRIPFQLSLGPLFLWGALLSGGGETSRLVLGFVSFHFFLYTGITAFNSAYDRDEGPVGGMRVPPPVPDHLLQFSLAVQGAGLLMAWTVGPVFTLLYATVALLAAGYSHPAIRWKRQPYASALIVLAGQGGGGFLGGWLAAGGTLSGMAGPHGILGILSASLTTLGLYPLTQVYQISEDRSRGDRTLAVHLGMEGALRFGLWALAFAAVSATLLMVLAFGLASAILVATAYAAILWQVHRYASACRAAVMDVPRAFQTSTRLNYLSSAGFLVFISLHLLGWL
jgi:4-hydroxybenzoate polyprenyltransferase